MFGAKDMETILIEKQLRQGITGIKRIAEIQSQIINSSKSTICINIENTEYIASAFVPVIASMPQLHINNKRIKIKYSLENIKMKKLLESQGVFKYYSSNASEIHEKDVIEFICIKDENEAIPILNKIFELAPINMKPDAEAILSSSLYEIFANSFNHGKNNSGTFCAGKWEKRKKQLIFSVYDHGIGIPKNVNTYLKKELSTKETIDWAFTKGNSTSMSDYPRGLGFSRLEDFVNANDGKITICSGDGIYIIEKNRRKFEKIENEILGTLFIMNIRADDEHIYVLR